MPSKTNEYAYETGRISSASPGTTSAVVLAADPKRRYAILCNTGNFDCFLAIGTPAVAGQGILLKSKGGAYELLAQNLTHAAVSAITSADATTISIQEGI
jgi:hypothetical protein